MSDRTPPSKAWLDQAIAHDGAVVLVRDDEIYAVEVEKVER